MQPTQRGNVTFNKACGKPLNSYLSDERVCTMFGLRGCGAWSAVTVGGRFFWAFFGNTAHGHTDYR